MGALTRRSEPDESLPGLQRAAAVPLGAPRPLTAAAARVKITNKPEVELLKARKAKAAWQSEAWEYFDNLGEIKYAFMLTGAIMSRMRLYLAMSTAPSDPPAALEDVKDIPEDVKQKAEAHFQRLNSGHGGIAGLLREFAVNLSVSGECYLVQQRARPASGVPEQWTIRSTDEIEVDSSGKASLRESRALPGTAGLRPLDEREFISRIWRPHPRFHDEADSSMRGLLELCAELLLLNRTVRATAKSRLNAGAMFIPDGLSVAAAPDVTDENGEVDTEDDDTFEQELVAAMTLPIQDEDSASAVVPLLIRGPGELGGQIKQFKFERSFDPALTERADRVLERILQGIDVPKDIVTGLASVKYSNAVVINESLYRAHIEPLTLVICDALTMTFLRPAMKAMGIGEEIVNRTFVWYDPSDILTSADRAANANEGWDRYLISGSAWRSAHGFAETDAPTGEELVKRIAVARGQITADLTEALLQQIAPGVLKAIREGNVGAQGPGVPQGLNDLLESGTLPTGGEPLPPEILEGLPTPRQQPPQAQAPEPEAPTEEPEAVGESEGDGLDLPFPDIFAARRT